MARVSLRRSYALSYYLTRRIPFLVIQLIMLSPLGILGTFLIGFDSWRTLGWWEEYRGELWTVPQRLGNFVLLILGISAIQWPVSLALGLVIGADVLLRVFVMGVILLLWLPVAIGRYLVLRVRFRVKLEREILLLRPFHRRFGSSLRRHVQPIIECYGFVRGLRDLHFNTAFPNAIPLDDGLSSDSDDGDTFVASNDGEWKQRVKSLMDEADLIVIDVSTLSPGVLWEVKETHRERTKRERTILIASIDSDWNFRDGATKQAADLIEAGVSPDRAYPLLYGSHAITMRRFARRFYEAAASACVD